MNTLLTVSYSTFIPNRCSTAARSKAPFGTAFCPVKPVSVNVVRAAGNASTEFLVADPELTLMVFVPFSVFYLREPLKLDYLWAGLCLVGAVYFAFRSKFT